MFIRVYQCDWYGVDELLGMELLRVYLIYIVLQ